MQSGHSSHTSSELELLELELELLELELLELELLELQQSTLQATRFSNIQSPLVTVGHLPSK
jgi:hypothetical protein